MGWTPYLAEEEPAASNMTPIAVEEPTVFIIISQTIPTTTTIAAETPDATNMTLFSAEAPVAANIITPTVPTKILLLHTFQ